MVHEAHCYPDLDAVPQREIVDKNNRAVHTRIESGQERRELVSSNETDRTRHGIISRGFSIPGLESDRPRGRTGDHLARGLRREVNDRSGYGGHAR
jgi:hypothetical protein